MQQDKFLPDVELLHQSESSAEFSLQLLPSNALFEGHFPNQPILPGVGQLYIAEALAKKYLDISGQFCRLEAIKFKSIIEPNAKLQLSLQFNAQKGKLSFNYSIEGQECSTGRMVFTQ